MKKRITLTDADMTLIIEALNALPFQGSTGLRQRIYQITSKFPDLVSKA